MVRMMKMNDENNLIFTTDFDKIIQTGIKIEHYLFLKILDSKNRVKLLNFYNEQHGALIRPKDVDFLFDKGLIDILKRDKPDDPNSINYFKNYSLSNMHITKLYYDLFEKQVKETSIEELKETYPKQTPAKKRRLQSDPDKWKSNYLKVIKGKPELHELIIKCIKAEAKHRRATNSEEYWPLLTTYINNRRWEDYEDAIDSFKEEDVSKDYDL